MRYRDGKTVHSDGEYSIRERIEILPNGAEKRWGYSLHGPRVEFPARFDFVHEAAAALALLKADDNH